MAKRNQKNGYHGGRALLWGVALGILTAAVAMVYLGMLNTCETIGQQIKLLETAQAELHKRVVNEERNWAAARSIRNMEQLMGQHGIAMSWPDQRNIIRLRPVDPAEPTQYAAQGGARRRD